MKPQALFGSSVTVVAALALLGCGRVGYELSGTQSLGGADASFSGAPGAGGGGATPPPGSGGSPQAGDGGDDGAPPGPAPCTGTVAMVTDPCTELPSLPASPIIDGLPDCGLPVYAADPEGWAADGAAPDAVLAYAVAWRPTGLYFFLRITDPTAVPANVSAPASYGDGVELYMDDDGSFTSPPAYDNPGTRRFVIAAPRDSVASEARGEVWVDATESSAAWSSSSFRVFPRSFGYVVEAFVTAGDLGVPRLDFAAGKTVGFDLTVNVSYPAPETTGAFGHRLGQYHLKGSSASPETDVGAFCTPALLGG